MASFLSVAIVTDQALLILGLGLNSAEPRGLVLEVGSAQIATNLLHTLIQQ